MPDFTSLANAGLISQTINTAPSIAHFLLTTDSRGQYAYECSWKIYKSDGEVLVAEVASGTLGIIEGTTQRLTMADQTYTGDYTLQTIDSYNDSWNGAQITVNNVDINGLSTFGITTTGPPNSLSPLTEILYTGSIVYITPLTTVVRTDLKAMVALGFTISQLIAGGIYTPSQIKTEFSGNAILLLMTTDYGNNSAADLLEIGYTAQELASGGITVWSQLGADIDGEAAFDNLGFSVSLSSDGTIVAIGARYNDGNGYNTGHVRIYKNISGTWTQLGADIDGEAAGDESGISVSLSSDGTIVAIGARYNDDSGASSGHVRVYQYDVTKTVAVTDQNSSTYGPVGWNRLGADIAGEYWGDYSGYSVSLSSDGTIVAIGAYGNDGNGSKSGHTRIYKNISGTWTQVGADIDGEAANDYSGYSVSLSSDGTIVAIGAKFNDGTASNAGQVRVYKNISGTWTQVGQDIDGEAAWDNLGFSVSLSSDGTIVAIGAPYNDGNGSNVGYVRIYKNISGTWTQLGADIDGEAAVDQSGWSVSLSDDGTIVAIGAKYNDANGSDSGHVRVYQYDGSVWTILGQDIYGEALGDQSGYSVSLSDDGLTVAIGAPYNDGTNGSNSGHVRVYELLTTAIAIPAPICFPKGTPVLTNLGPVAIEKLNTDKHTIRGKDIIAITQSKPLQKHIVCFEKDALSKNVPSQQTLCSMEHKIFYQGEMTKARNLVDLCENVTFVPYNGETLFNVLLKKHDKMMINNLICETLHPENIAAKISTMKDGQKKNQAIQELTKIIKENNVPEYQKLYASL